MISNCDLLHKYLSPRHSISFSPLVDQLATDVNTAAGRGRRLVFQRSITDGAVVMGQAGVTSSIAGGKTYWGTPIEEFYTKRKELIWIKRIPEIWEKLNKK